MTQIPVTLFTICVFAPAAFLKPPENRGDTNQGGAHAIIEAMTMTLRS
jgi:hypothetical protein